MCRLWVSSMRFRFTPCCAQDFRAGQAALLARCNTLMGTLSMDQRGQTAARFLYHCLHKTGPTSVSAGSFFTSVLQPPELPHQLVPAP